jgi:hypothetical protein
MAQSGYTPILIYASGTASNTPSSGNLTTGASGAELAINYADGKLFYKDSSNVVQVLATKGTGPIGGSTTQVQYNNAGALAGSANLTFDGTNLTSGGTITGTKLIPTGTSVTGNGLYLPAANALGLSTNGTNAVYIDANQNVGIGTSSPASKLNVLGSINNSANSLGTLDSSTLTVQNSNSAALQITSKLNLGVTSNGVTYGYSSIASAYTNFNGAGDIGTAMLFGTQTNASGGTVERMRIESNGNVNIGGVTDAGNTLRYFDIYNTNTGASAGSIIRLVTANVASSSNVTVDITKYKSGAFTINNNETNTAAYTSFGVGGSERMRINSSGNVGIGTSSPSGKLHVDGGSYDSLTVSGNSSNSVGARFQNSAASSKNWNIGSSGGGPSPAGSFFIYDDTSSATRMVIDSSGNLLVGTTSTISGAKVGIANVNGGQAGLGIGNTGGSSFTTAISFRNSNGEVGVISTNGSATSYTTSSDYRLKENIAPMTGALAKVALLKPCTYKWNADGSDGEGFIAHELQAVCPDAVTGEKDAVNAEGSPKYQGIDTSFLVATLTAAIQEQQALITSLTARITALENK